MEKRLYGKPLMSVEQFTPSEYVSVCWYVESGNCYNSIYHDNDHDGRYNAFTDPSENLYYDNAHSSSAHRIPESGFFNTRSGHNNTKDYTTLTNDGYYYTDHKSLINWDPLGYIGSITSPILSVEINNKTHYFRNITKAKDNPS